MPHTKDLIDEALNKIQVYLERENQKETSKFELFKHGTGINKFTEKLGIHVIKTSLWRQTLKFSYSNLGKHSCIDFYNLAVKDPQSFDEFYEMLENDDSKKEYDWYVKYRTAYAFLGERAYDLFTPRITKEMYQKLESQVKESKSDCFEIDGYLLKNDRGILIDTFLIEQYRLPNLVEPIKGDIVFDVGACFGDTAFWFKKYIGDSGRVFAFEPVSYNFAILKENIERSKITNIIPEKLALSDTDGEFSISGQGGGASLSSSGAEKVRVTNIDRFVQDQKLNRVDFIKMDIEGAELGALMGAENTLKKLRPKLAICVYHKGEDLMTIPKYIKSVNENYKFFMRHNTTNLGETVLYAISTV